MGRAIEVISAIVTAPTSTFTAMVALTGDSTVVRNSQKKAYMLAAWQQRQSAGSTRILSPLLHDNVRGITYSGGVGVDIGPIGAPLQELYPQDTLSLTGTGSAVAGDIETSSYLVMYDDLPGIDGHFIGTAELRAKAVARFAVRVTSTSVATGQNSVAAAINVTEDAFKANTNYAIVGMATTSAVCSVGIKSPDWGNLRVGIPGVGLQTINYGRWFVLLSELTNMPCIPVFNSANKALTTLDFCDDENAPATQTFTLNLVELK